MDLEFPMSIWNNKICLNTANEYVPTAEREHGVSHFGDHREDQEEWKKILWHGASTWKNKMIHEYNLHESKNKVKQQLKNEK